MGEIPGWDVGLRLAPLREKERDYYGVTDVPPYIYRLRTCNSSM